MDPTILNDLLASLRDSIFNVLTQNGTPFQQLGLTIFRTLVITMIVIAGIRIAFSDHHSLHKLRTLAGFVLVVWIMLTLYTRSSPLLGGYSFSEAIPRSAFGMADLVGNTTQHQMLMKLDSITHGVRDMGEFSLLHVRDFILYFLISTDFFTKMEPGNAMVVELFRKGIKGILLLGLALPVLLFVAGRPLRLVALGAYLADASAMTRAARASSPPTGAGRLSRTAVTKAASSAT